MIYHKIPKRNYIKITLGSLISPLFFFFFFFECTPWFSLHHSFTLKKKKTAECPGYTNFESILSFSKPTFYEVEHLIASVREFINSCERDNDTSIRSITPYTLFTYSTHYWTRENYTLGGRELPAFSHPIVSTGASSEDRILRIPSRTFIQFGGGSPVLTKLPVNPSMQTAIKTY